MYKSCVTYLLTEKAYQTATKLKLYEDLIYANEQHKSLTSKFDKKICAIQREEETDCELRQMKDEMKWHILYKISAAGDVWSRVLKGQYCRKRLRLNSS